jgi:NAD(P)-dependent dehydrogenase (short-subunit alcohol dehydrogenase family)
MMRLKDKVAIVTGGGAGIGQAIAAGYGREGAKVVVADVNSLNGEATAVGLRNSGGEAIFVQTDVAVSTEVQNMVTTAVAQYGAVDVLVNNAGVQLFDRDARAHELSEEAWDRTHSINLRGAWLCSKYAIPVMLRQGGGAIINVASPTGLTGCAPGFTAYSSSKGGMFALTRVMAVDYARDKIRVNALVPGTTLTPLTEEVLADPDFLANREELMPIGRLGQPEDVVGLAVFLASDEAQFCVGGFYMVDGGMTAA